MTAWRTAVPRLSRFAVEHLLLLPLGALIALVWANVGPESTANAASRSPSTSAETSDIRASVSFSMPFVPEMMRTGAERWVRRFVSTSR